MKIEDRTSHDVHTAGGGETPPCIGLTPNALPDARSCVAEQSSQTGVSTNSALPRCKIKRHNPKEIPHWYAL